MDDLRDLNLFNTRVTDAGLKGLSRLKHVRNLYLAGCVEVTDAGVQGLTAHKGLQTISLFNCEKITDESLKVLGGLKELKEVEIPNCKFVTDAGLKELVKLTNLDVGGTQVSGPRSVMTPESLATTRPSPRSST